MTWRKRQAIFHNTLCETFYQSIN